MRTSLGERLADATVRLAEARAEFDRQVCTWWSSIRPCECPTCTAPRIVSPYAATRDAVRFLRDDAA